MLGINAGSGQRPFSREHGWINCDINPRWNPDIVGDWSDLSAFADGTVDYVVSHHSLEHVGCGEGDPFMREANRVLRPGGSLLIFVPDLRALAERWLLGQISDYIYIVNLMGAYMSDEADRHKWHHTRASLKESLSQTGKWSEIKPFDWRKIDGADIAGPDFWILGIEAVK